VIAHKELLPTTRAHSRRKDFSKVIFFMIIIFYIVYCIIFFVLSGLLAPEARGDNRKLHAAGKRSGAAETTTKQNLR